MAKKGIKNDQVYRGRFKGSTRTHVPNNKFREEAERIGLGGYSVECSECGEIFKGTKIETELWEITHECRKE